MTKTGRKPSKKALKKKRPEKDWPKYESSHTVKKEDDTHQDDETPAVVVQLHFELPEIRTGSALFRWRFQQVHTSVPELYFFVFGGETEITGGAPWVMEDL